MARVKFDPTNVRQDESKFPKLKLEKDEVARILCIEEVPWSQWVHTLRAPKIVNGGPQTVVKERKNGEKYEDYEMDFIGRPICLGDEGILADHGVDPKNCPACELAVSGDLADRPQRRFAMHVLKYATKPGTTDLLPQFNLQLLVWAFTDKTFDKLTTFTQEWGSLLQHDLLLGPCTNPTFQQFDINIAGKAEWLGNEDRKQLAVEMFKQNKISDEALAAFCGRKVARAWMEEDLDKIKERWRIASGAEASSGPAWMSGGGRESLVEGLESLTSQTGMAAPTESLEADSAVGSEVLDLEPVEESKDSTDKAPGKPGSSGESLGFDDLLNL